jgi:hypothetical protein
MGSLYDQDLALWSEEQTHALRVAAEAQVIGDWLPEND